ncbi:hypothetical protein HanRHA438_Chr16g0764901 [Helianthus annuus]|nr:hypothetical protein HanRHA438_Chr16g0764901 [Helianthus annuus]
MPVLIFVNRGHVISVLYLLLGYDDAFLFEETKILVFVGVAHEVFNLLVCSQHA